MLYQVQITLLKPVTPPYSEWLKPHVQEMLELKGEGGEALFAAADIQQKDDVFTVFYQTTESHFAYYEATYAEKMRTAFKDTYGTQVSAFAFERKIVD